MIPDWDDRDAVRDTPLGQYFSEDEWQHVGHPRDRHQRASDVPGPADAKEATVQAALLQFAPENQRSWERLLALAHWSSRPAGGTAGAAILGNSMPMKELALFDDPPEAPHTSEALTCWGPVAVINQKSRRDGRRFGNLSQVLASLAPEDPRRHPLALLRLAFELLKRLEPYVAGFSMGGEQPFKQRDLELPKDAEAIRHALVIPQAEWLALLKQYQVTTDVAELLFRPDPWRGDAHQWKLPPLRKIGSEIILSAPAMLAGTAASHAERMLGSQLESVLNAYSALVLDEAELAMNALGCRRLSGPWFELDQRRAALLLPVNARPTHRGPWLLDPGPEAEQAMANVPAGFEHVLVVLLDCDLPRGWDLSLTLKESPRYEAPPVMLPIDTLVAAADVAGRDPLLLWNYARDLKAFARTHILAGVDPPELMGMFLIDHGFPTSWPRDTYGFVPPVRAGGLHNIAQATKPRRYLRDPEGEWVSAVSHPGNHHLAIYRAEASSDRVVTKTPRPLWLKPAGLQGKPPPALLYGILDSLSYWLSKWADIQPDLPGWNSIPQSGASVIVSLADGPGPWPGPGQDGEPQVTVGRSGNRFFAMIVAGSDEFLARPHNDYEHFLAYSFLVGLHKALGSTTRPEAILEEVMERLLSPHERRLLHGIHFRGMELVPLPGPSFAMRTAPEGSVRERILAIVRAAGFPAETAAPETEGYIEGYLRLLAADTWQQMGRFDRVALLELLLHANESLIHERAAAHARLAAAGVQLAGDDTIVHLMEHIIAHSDKCAPATRWLVEMAGTASSGAARPALGDWLDLLQRAHLYLSGGMYLDGYRRGQITSAFAWAGPDALQPTDNHYAAIMTEHRMHDARSAMRGSTETMAKHWTPAPEEDDEDQPSPYNEAFRTESGATFDETVLTLAAAVGVVARSHVIHSSTWQDLVDQTAALSKQPRAVVMRVLSHFCRAQQPPTETEGSEASWNTMRRNSLILRPFVRLGDRVLIGPRQLQRSCQYFANLCDAGRMPGTTPEWRVAMQRQQGRASRRMERDLAELLRKAGWTARDHVLPEEIGLEQHLGDYDVLAANKKGWMLAIEAKAFAPSITPLRLAAEWKELYQGSGAAVKHSNRVKVLADNPHRAATLLGMERPTWEVFGIILTPAIPGTRRFAKDKMLALGRDELEMLLEDGMPPHLWPDILERQRQDE